MLIYWKVGDECNLSCSYCSIVGVRKRSAMRIGALPSPYVKEVADFLRRACLTENGEQIRVVFYGGEPLLYQDSIADLLGRTRELPIRYSIHTNGTLLDEIRPEIASRLDFIFVSVDGDEVATDLHRGKGTYRRIRNAVTKARARFRGEMIARATLTFESSLTATMRDLLQWLDGMTWQIENSPVYDQCRSHDFLLRYEEEVGALARDWATRMARGSLLNVLPFRAVAHTLLFGRRGEGLRCGCGTDLVVVDGLNCFACDELQGASAEISLGSITETISARSYPILERIREACSGCSIERVCGGRCLNSLAFFPRDKFLFYCRATRALVSSIEGVIPDIRQALERNLHGDGRLAHEAMEVIDHIP